MSSIVMILDDEIPVTTLTVILKMFTESDIVQHS